MDKLGFRPNAHATIIAHLDTQNLSDEIRHVGYISLRSLVREEVSPKQLYGAGVHPKSCHSHIADNNAVSTLEARLLFLLKEDKEAVNPPSGWFELTKLYITLLPDSNFCETGSIGC